MARKPDRRQAGEFDRPVTLEQDTPTTAVGLSGAETPVWATFAQGWARRRALHGLERYTAQQISAEVSVAYDLREPCDGLTSDMRLLDDAEALYYDIAGILPAERTGGGQRLLCKLHRD